MWFVIIVTAIVGVLFYKLFLSSPNDYWKKLGIREIDTSSVVGALDIFLSRKTMSEADVYAYNKMGSTDKFCGIVQLGKPLLLVKDMDLLKKVLIKDFECFSERRQIFHKADGIVEKMLVNLVGDEWKGVRSSISPTFTTGKIRRMMEYFNSVGKEWVAEYTRKAKADPSGSVVIEVMKSVNQYTLDVISNTVFGMNAGVIKNPDCIFSKMAFLISDFGKAQTIKMALRSMFPGLSRLLGFSILNYKAVTYFERILERELKSRLSGETKRNDFLQLLVEAKKGELQASGADELSSFENDAQISIDTQKKQYLTEEMMTAQSVVFFFAGFSSTSSVITFALYALTLHQDVQDRLRKEVQRIVKEDGTLDYDDIMRILFGSSRLERLCIKDYSDPESGLVIPKGTMVGIPTSGLHHDKQYYDNPEKFDPEHFSPEKKAKRHPYAFMPFGVGPRNCIGMRFALIEVKAVIAHIVHGFMIEPTPKTPVPFHGIPAGSRIVPPKNLEVKLIPIDKKT